MSKSAATWVCWRDPAHTVNETFYGWPVCFACGAAPVFHERWEYLRDNIVLGIYVLKPGPLNAIIAPRSGVVGLHDGGDGAEDRTELYYEGWVNGPMQYADRDARGLWEAGIKTAAGRMVTRYPTIACATPKSDAVRAIGLYHVKEDVVAVDDEQALTQWLEA